MSNRVHCRESTRRDLAISESKGRLKENAKPTSSSLIQKETSSKVQNLVRVRAGESVTPGDVIAWRGHGGGHGWSRGENDSTYKANKVG